MAGVATQPDLASELGATTHLTREGRCNYFEPDADR